MNKEDADDLVQNLKINTSTETTLAPLQRSQPAWFLTSLKEDSKGINLELKNNFSRPVYLNPSHIRLSLEGYPAALSLNDQNQEILPGTITKIYLPILSEHSQNSQAKVEFSIYEKASNIIYNITANK